MRDPVLLPKKGCNIPVRPLKLTSLSCALTDWLAEVEFIKNNSCAHYITSYTSSHELRLTSSIIVFFLRQYKYYCHRSSLLLLIKSMAYASPVLDTWTKLRCCIMEKWETISVGSFTKLRSVLKIYVHGKNSEQGCCVYWLAGWEMRSDN